MFITIQFEIQKGNVGKIFFKTKVIIWWFKVQTKTNVGLN